MKTYVRLSAALLRQSGTAPQGIETSVLSVLPSSPTGKHTFPHCQCPRMLETYVRHSAAILPQSGTAPQGIRNIRSLRAASPPTGKHTFPHCQCPRPPVSVLGHLSVSPDAGNIRSPQCRNSATIWHGPASYRKHMFHKPSRSPATPATTSTPKPKNICSPSRPATSTYANNPRTTPSQMSKHMFSQLAQLPQTPRPAVTSQ